MTGLRLIVGCAAVLIGAVMLLIDWRGKKGRLTVPGIGVVIAGFVILGTTQPNF